MPPPAMPPGGNSSVWARRVGAICLLLSLTTRAEAKDPAEARATVIFYVDGSSASAGRYATALAATRAQLVDMDVRLDVERGVVWGTDVADVRERMDRIAVAPGAGGRTLAGVWLDLRRPGDILVFIADASARRVLVRRIQLSAGSEGAAFEEMGVIVRSTVSALLEGRAIGMEAAPPAGALARTAPTPSASAPASAAPPVTPAGAAAPAAREGAVPASAHPEVPAASAAGAPVRVATETPASPSATPGDRSTRSTAPRPREHVESLRLGVAYVGGSFAAGAGWQSGATLSAGYVAPFGVYGSVSYDIFPAASLLANGVDLRLARHPGSLAAGYELPLFESRVRLAAEVALMADSIERTAAAAPGFVPAPDASRWVWALGPRARVGVRLWAPVWLSVGVGLDVALTHFDYVVSPAVPVLALDAVRSRVELGLTGALF